jgi:putative ABC transport system permease protein
VSPRLCPSPFPRPRVSLKMGTLTLILKQMRQRALATWLTLLSVLLGVALAIAILLMRDAGQALFGQTEYGYDAIVGIGKGSPTSLVMNTVYHIDKSPGNIPYWVYEQLNTQARARGREFDYHRHIKLAVPTAVGDTYKGRAIIGTLSKMFISLEPLKQQIQTALDEARSAEAAIKENAPDKWPGNLAGTLKGMETSAAQIKQEVIRTDRETVPLVLPPPEDGSAPKFKYGDPAFPLCEQAAQQLHDASDALQNKRASGAIKCLDKVYSLLEQVYEAASAAGGPLEYRPDKSYELAEGRFFYPWKLEAVIGSEVAQNAGLGVGSVFQATHGSPPPDQVPDIHPEKWRVVGVLKPTHTAADRCLYIPLVTFYCIAEHGEGLKGHEKAREGQALQGTGGEPPPDYHLASGKELLPDLPDTKDFVSLDVPSSDWEVSAILVKARGDVAAQQLLYYISNGGIKDVEAVNPAQVMRQFFDIFLKPSAQILLLISLLVSIVAAVGILVSIYNSVSARTREIAILRALGATKGRVLTLICAEAVLIGLAGALAGLVAGHVVGGIVSRYLNATFGQGFDWISVRSDEWLFVLLVAVIAFFAGLVPALKAYRTPVATNLVAA